MPMDKSPMRQKIISYAPTKRYKKYVQMPARSFSFFHFNKSLLWKCGINMSFGRYTTMVTLSRHHVVFRMLFFQVKELGIDGDVKIDISTKDLEKIAADWYWIVEIYIRGLLGWRCGSPTPRAKNCCGSI
jgi:hypothetical protein